MGTLPDPNAPVTQDDVTGNFPDEFFYQAGDSGIDNVGATDAQGKLGKASLVASLEGAFFNGPPEANQQMVFARLRLKVTSGLQPDTEYTFVHPYGERKIKTDPGEDNLFVTEDIGASRRHLRRRAQGPHRAVPQVGPVDRPGRRRTATSATRTSTTRSRAASTTTSRSSAPASAPTS